MRFWTISSGSNLLENGNCLGNCGSCWNIHECIEGNAGSLFFLYDWSSVKMDLKEEGRILTSFVIEYIYIYIVWEIAAGIVLPIVWILLEILQTFTFLVNFYGYRDNIFFLFKFIGSNYGSFDRMYFFITVFPISRIVLQ